MTLSIEFIEFESNAGAICCSSVWYCSLKRSADIIVTLASVIPANTSAESIAVRHPILNIDCKLNPVAIDNELLDALATLEPFGAGNPTPMFGLYNMTITDIHEVGGGKHLKLSLSRGDCTVTAMKFSMSKDTCPFELYDTVDCAVTLDKNIYNNIENKEKVLQQSTKNEDLIDLLSTEKTLVYFGTSLKENDLVLERLSKGLVLPLFEGDLDLLEDALIENRQAIDMAGIYQNILNSITETYATIVSNNLNNVMKFLAGATIVLSIPTIISSFLGMNVQFGVIGISNFSAIAILLFSILASVLVALWLKKKGMI